MKEQEIVTKSAEETRAAAGRFVSELLRDDVGRRARVIALWGDLGSGKTTFTQGIAAALGVKGVVNSPTFLIMKKYPLSGGCQGMSLYHLDCYRASSTEEIVDLGWEEIAGDADNFVVVEWPEKIMELLPPDRTDISFQNLSGDGRRIVFGKAS